MMKRLRSLSPLGFILPLVLVSCGETTVDRTVYVTYSTIKQVSQSKPFRTASEKKMSSSLLEVLRQFQANGNSFDIPDSLAAGELFLQPTQVMVDGNGRMNVYIYSEYRMDTVDAVGQLQQELEDSIGLDMAKNVSLPRTPVVQSWVHPGKLLDIARLASVRSVSFVTPPLMSSTEVKGGVRLRADAALHLLAESQSHTITKVGVLSDDCGEEEGYLEDCIEDWALKHTAEALDGKDNSLWRTHEGLAMMQVVHDVDSTADILFATAVGDNEHTGMLTFQKNIKALAEAGCRVLVDDILYIQEPAFEDGPIAKTIEELADDIVYVSAAGNWAKNVYSFKFAPMPGKTYGAFDSWEFGTIHDTSQGWYKQSFTIPDGQYVEAMLQWDDPFGNSCNDFELYLTDIATGTILASSTTSQNGEGSNPYEHLTYLPNACFGAKGYRLFVTYFGTENKAGVLGDADSNTTPRMKLLLLGPDVENDLPMARSIFGHAASDSVIACGAMYGVANYNVTETWSSRGDVEIVDVTQPVDSTGSRPLVNNRLRLKPDVVSLDRVTTTVVNFESFWGTSAAAPHVAGIASLIIKADPKLSAYSIRQCLIQSCIDYELPGRDNICGYGRADAFIAVATARYTGDKTHRFAQFFTTAADGTIPLITVPELDYLHDRLYISLTVDGYTATHDLSVKIDHEPHPELVLFSAPMKPSGKPVYPNIVFLDNGPRLESVAVWPKGFAKTIDLMSGSAPKFNAGNVSGSWGITPSPTLPPEIQIKSWGIYLE